MAVRQNQQIINLQRAVDIWSNNRLTSPLNSVISSFFDKEFLYTYIFAIVIRKQGIEEFIIDDPTFNNNVLDSSRFYPLVKILSAVFGSPETSTLITVESPGEINISLETPGSAVAFYEDDAGLIYNDEELAGNRDYFSAEAGSVTEAERFIRYFITPYLPAGIVLNDITLT